MKIIGKLISIILLITLTTIPSLAKSKPKMRSRVITPTVYNTESLRTAISQIIQEVDPQASVGLQIKSMKRDQILYSQNENALFTPASILKILTAEAALLYLGPDYKFTTRLVTDAKTASNGIVDGNMYLVHSGDPSLTFYDFTDLMVALKSQQIQGLTGNLYVDNTAYDQNNTGPGWDWKDTRSCYGAPINASIINHNCISFELTPAKIEGRRANIVQNPRYYYPGFENGVVTKSSRARSCRISLNSNPNNIISLYGCMPKGHYTRGASIVIENILEYNKSLLRDLFKQYEIQVGGYVSAQRAPQNTITIASHESKPLRLLVSEMMKKSNNIIAGTLFKKMGSLAYQQPGSWQNGGEAVKHILAQKAQVNISQMDIIDGSGLSRDNQVTPAQIMQVLDFAFHHYGTNYEFISSLPIAGIDGTLKNRLSNVARKVRAKTGTIAGVVSLAGYVVTKNKEPLGFVIIINGQKGNIWKYREIEDKIVTALTNFSR